MTSPLADEILRRLLEAEGNPVSGQFLAQQLGVTRAAVWKAVETLRGDDYRVESLPSRGYRLAATPRGLRAGAIEAALRTSRLGRTVRYLRETDSTNREAERWALEGAPEGALVVAEAQTKGRGRLGRSWFDLPRRSLLFSLVLRPPMPPALAPGLTFVAAVALAEALARWVPRERVEIKWPNDVLIDAKKVAGILLEMNCEAQRVQHILLGVGINVGGAARDFPEELRASCTTVAEHAPAPPDRLGVLCAVLEALETEYDDLLSHGMPAIVEHWNRWSRIAGRDVRVQTPGAVVEGVALGLGPDGSLAVDTGRGEPTMILAGDVELSTTRRA